MTGLFSNGYALLIAVNENNVPGWVLPDVAKDVNALHKVFTHPERCGYPGENVKVITGQDSTRTGILDGLEWLADRIQTDQSGETTAVIYYSGHGWRDEEPQPPNYYLIPYDVRKTTVRLSALPADDFAGAISALRPNRLLVVLDCCHSGGMDIKGLTPGYLGSAIPPQLIMGSVEKSIPASGGAKDLGTLVQGRGRAVLSSSQGTQKSYIRKDKKMSIFTYHLIEALTGCAQPQDGAPEVLVSDVLSYVTRKVPASTERDWGAVQQPDNKLDGNFAVALVMGGKGLVEGQPAPDPLEDLPGESRAGEHSSVQIDSISDVSGGQISIAGRDVVTHSTQTVETGGGAFVGGNLNTGGGDFVGRDKVVSGDEVHGDKTGGDKITVGDITDSAGVAIGSGAQARVNYGLSGREIEGLFLPVLEAIRQGSSASKPQALQMTEQLQQEAAKGESANDGIVAALMNGVVELAPGAVSALVSAFTSPLLAGVAGPVTKMVLDSLTGK